MTDKILLVGHGSRNKNGNIEIEKFAHEWRKRNPQWSIETCFIEFADVLLDQGLDKAAIGASRVIVVPLILNAAGHVKMEIPSHMVEARQRHPRVEFIYTPHLGACEAILNILKRELRDTLKNLDVPDPRTTGVILLGRGSSDRIANGEVAKMARWLFEETDHDQINIAFTGITNPRLESVVKNQHKLDMSQVVILPYYLFTGTLIERIERQVERIKKQYPQIAFTLGSYFGFENEIYELLSQRVFEAMGEKPDKQTMMECDGCKFREIAEEHGHGHHHDHTHEHQHPKEAQPA